jgi:hypothetical protein
LSRLRDLGLYSGKQDRRKNLSPYQQKLIVKFDDVLKGRARVVEPKAPQSYRGIYKVQGKKVIVPRERGERISVNKQGEIVSRKRGPPGFEIYRRGIRVPVEMPTGRPAPIPPPAPERRVQYAIPFARKVGRGQYRMEWHRFGNWDDLAAFMAEYEPDRYGDWREYVFEEEISSLSREERDRQLDDALVRHGKVRNADEIIGAGRRVRRARERGRYRRRAERDAERDE